MSIEEVIRHIAKFTSNIWQIHPFCEGNTRATAVFVIKYMKTLGFDVNNSAFEHHSWYVRNALVRANYNNIKNGIHATTKFLEQFFFSNLLLGTKFDLKNRCMHVDYVEKEKNQSANFEIPKCQNDTLDEKNTISLIELTILNCLISNPSMTQMELAKKTGKSVRTVKRVMSALKVIE